MRNILLLTVNTLKITFRKKSNIIVFLLLPVIITIAAMTLYQGNTSNSTKIGILNKDIGILATDMVNSLSKTDKYKIEYLSEIEIKDKVASGKLDCAIIFPVNFSESIYNDKFDKLEILSIKGETSTAWIDSYVGVYIKNLLSISKASMGDKAGFNKIYESYNKNGISIKSENVKDQTNSKYVTITSLGFLIMFIMIGTSNTSTLMLKEKRNRTYYRICSAPVSGITYIISNIISNLIIVFVQVFLVITFMTKVFKINTFVPNYQLFIILMCFGLVAVSLGVLIVSFSNSTAQAGYFGSMILTPTCMLGGCFWPMDIMPKSIQNIGNFMPQKWTLDAIDKIQKGSSFSGIWINIVITLAFALAFFLIAIYNLNNKNNVNNII